MSNPLDLLNQAKGLLGEEKVDSLIDEKLGGIPVVGEELAEMLKGSHGSNASKSEDSDSDSEDEDSKEDDSADDSSDDEEQSNDSDQDDSDSDDNSDDKDE